MMYKISELVTDPSGFQHCVWIQEANQPNKKYTNEWYLRMVEAGETRTIDECNNELNQGIENQIDLGVRKAVGGD